MRRSEDERARHKALVEGHDWAQIGHKTPESASTRPGRTPAETQKAPLGFGRSEDQIEAWISRWPDEPTPALGGLTPRAAAKGRKQRVRLEALLREFEHDAHLAARRGSPHRTSPGCAPS